MMLVHEPGWSLLTEVGHSQGGGLSSKDARAQEEAGGARDSSRVVDYEHTSNSSGLARCVHGRCACNSRFNNLPLNNLACVARRLSSRAGRLQARSCSKALSVQLQTPHLAVVNNSLEEEGGVGNDQHSSKGSMDGATHGAKWKGSRGDWKHAKTNGACRSLRHSPRSAGNNALAVRGDAYRTHLRRGGYRRGLDTDEVSPGSERDYRMPMAGASQITIRDQLSRTENHCTSCLVARDLTRGHTGKESGWGDQRGGES